MAIRCNQEIVPITIEFFIGENPRPFLLTQVWDKGKVNKSQNEIIIKENLPISILCKWDEGAYIEDLEARLYIETAIYNEEGKQHLELLQVGEIKHLFHFGDNNPFPWRMGYYFLEFHYKGKLYQAPFEVQPIHMTKEQVGFIYRYLEDEVTNICYDLIYSGKSFSGDWWKNKSLQWYYDYSRWVINNQSDIFACLHYLEKQPDENISNRYVVEVREGKQDQKSELWLGTPKGINRNQGFSPPTFLNNKRKLINRNTHLNQWVKHLIIQWISEVTLALELIEKDLIQQDKEVKNLIAKQEIISERTAEFRQRYDLAVEQKDADRTQLKGIKRKLGKLEYWRVTLNQAARVLRRLNNRLFFLKVETYREIERAKKSPLIIKQPIIQRFITLVEESHHIFQRHGEEMQYTPLIKQTWRLYEFFVLFKVIEIIRDKGFYPLKQAIDLFTSFLEHDRLQEGIMFRLEKEDAIIEVWYEKCLTIRSNAEQEGESFFAGSVISPDVRLDYYQKKEDGKLWFVGSMVMDAKHRKFKSLYDESYYNTVEKQLTGYHTIFYRKENADPATRRRSVVDKVLCIYSRDQDAEIRKDQNNLIYIQFFPEIDDINGFEVVGHNYLEKEIVEWMESCAPNFIPNC